MNHPGQFCSPEVPGRSGFVNVLCPWRLLRSFVFFILLFPTGSFFAQQTPTPQVRRMAAATQGGIYLVFPFENAGASPRLDWIGEGLEELTIQRLSAAGQQVYSHSGRLDETDRYGLPSNAKLSRATMLHIAEELDADYVIFGSFTSDGTTLQVNARVLRVNPVALLPAVNERGPLASLMELHNRVTWRLLSGVDRNYPLSLKEFSSLQRPLQLAAFEQYVRGLIAGDDEARLRDLKEAARQEPDWPDPAFALGELYFARNDCASALTWYARVPPAHDRSVEAVFATGVCRLRLNQPEQAEKLFSTLQDDLKRNMVSGADLPEILNNLALARARQGNLSDAMTSLGRARDIDPDEDDYPFNLGLLALQSNDVAAATTHFREAAQREPDNAEDRAFLIYCLEKSGKKDDAAAERSAAAEALGPAGLPSVKPDPKNATALVKYQRVKRELDTTSLRLELAGAQPATKTLPGSTPPPDTAVAHIRQGRLELAAGRLDAAEKEFRAAIARDPRSAQAHRELGELYRRRGKLDEAVEELNTSLAEHESAAVHVTLARVYLDQKRTDLARAEVEKAVKLAPNYAEAKELLDHLGKPKPAGGAQ